jgi:hypothetical protein
VIILDKWSTWLSILLFISKGSKQLNTTETNLISHKYHDHKKFDANLRLIVFYNQLQTIAIEVKRNFIQTV